MAETDADVIARSCREPRAFAVIFDRHYDAMHRFLWTRIGDAAEDLAAEVFRIAFERRGDYDVAYPSAKPWLFGIAARLVKQHARDDARRHEVQERLGGRTEGSVADASAALAATQPERVIEAAIPSAPVADALFGLEERDREPLLLHVWDGLRYDEVARVLDLPVGTVRSRIHRARARLREQLDGRGREAAIADPADAQGGVDRG